MVVLATTCDSANHSDTVHMEVSKAGLVLEQPFRTKLGSMRKN